jgi:hypothetical protein
MSTTVKKRKVKHNAAPAPVVAAAPTNVITTVAAGSSSSDAVAADTEWLRDNDEFLWADRVEVVIIDEAAAATLGIAALRTEWRLRYKQSYVSGDEWRQRLEVRFEGSAPNLPRESLTKIAQVAYVAPSMLEQALAAHPEWSGAYSLEAYPAVTRFFVGDQCVREQPCTSFASGVRRLYRTFAEFSPASHWDEDDAAQQWWSALAARARALRAEQCSQLGCTRAATCELTLKKLRCRECLADERVHAGQPRAGRRFCMDHCTRGNCRVIDEDTAYDARHHADCKREVPPEAKSRSNAVIIMGMGDLLNESV